MALEQQTTAFLLWNRGYENRNGIYNEYSLNILHFVQVELYSFRPNMSFEVVVGAFLSFFTCFFLAIEVE